MNRLLVVLACMVALTGSEAVAAAADDDVSRIINNMLLKKWRENNLQAAERCNDLEFLRRASLDIIGRIPTPEEIAAFSKDDRPDKRSHLVNRLLESKDYARHWADVWTTLLVTPSANPVCHDKKKLDPPVLKDITARCPRTPASLTIQRYDGSPERERLRAWLEQQFANDVSHKKLVERLLTATGKSTDINPVYFFIANRGEQAPQEYRHLEEWRYTMVPLTMRILRVFLGYRIQPNPWHVPTNHSDWTAVRFWGANAFFNAVRIKDQQVNELKKDESEFFADVVYYETPKRLVLPTRAIFLNRRFDRRAEGNLREQFAKFLIEDRQFSRAYVNRMWGHFFGRGLNEFREVDDFGWLNEVVHPELLAYLARKFEAAGHDPKALIRWICSSDAYQLKCAVNETNAGEEQEVYFSRMLLKLLGPEQLLDSVLVAARPASARDPEARRKLRARLFEHFVIEIGDGEADEITFNRAVTTKHLQDLMFLINSDEVEQAIRAEDGSAAAASKMGDFDQAMEHVYLAGLTRKSTRSELGRLRKDLQMGRATPEALQDLLWALLNSAEFAFNH